MEFNLESWDHLIYLFMSPEVPGSTVSLILGHRFKLKFSSALSGDFALSH